MKTSKFAKGHKSFKKNYFDKNEEHLRDLVKNGQKPKALFIGCSDSRFVPDLITNSKPGELFTVRNVGNFVPPYKPDNDFHGTATGIEYAISVLNVKDIIVCGHSHCGACAALYQIDEIKQNKDLVHLSTWLKLGDNVREEVLANGNFKTEDEKLRETEKVSVIHQLQHLLTYPEVSKRIESGKIKIHGWYYKLESGELESYDFDLDDFVPIDL